MIHPFQAEQFHKHAFGKTAERLGLHFAYIEDDDKRRPMERWIRIAQSIVAGAGDDGIAANMKFLTTENTAVPTLAASRVAA